MLEDLSQANGTGRDWNWDLSFLIRPSCIILVPGLHFGEIAPDAYDDINRKAFPKGNTRHNNPRVKPPTYKSKCFVQ